MKLAPWLGALLACCLFVPAAHATHKKPRLAGTVIDHTANHRKDRRICSAALKDCRDLYVYLPPCYDADKKYPLLIWLHGLGVDEQGAVDQLLPKLDRAIVCGRLPPMIVAIPDGTRDGKAHVTKDYSFFINSNMGCFEDYLEQDVWEFVNANYPIRPERGAHVLMGYSGGGTAAYYHAIRYKERYGAVVGIAPGLNLRWLDCHGRYFSDFDPNCWGWRESSRPGHAVIGRFFCVVTFRVGQLVYPLFGRGPDAIVRLSQHNPIEMLDSYDLKEGELAMFAAYGGRDQFNIDAHVESFVHLAGQRGVTVTTTYEPRASHLWRDMEDMLPRAFDWLAPLVAPYAPDREIIHEAERRTKLDP